MKIIDLKQGTLEWHEWRRSGIGSSDIAAIRGVSPWKKALDVYNEKTGFAPEKEPNWAMKRGSYYEAEALALFNAELPIKYKPCCMTHSNYEYCIASLDGYCEEAGNILEIKVPGKKFCDSLKTSPIPDYYVFQMQWQMFVSGAFGAIFYCYNPDEKFIGMQTFERDESLIKELHESAEQFWFNLLKGIPPKNIDRVKSIDRTEISDTKFEQLSATYKITQDQIKQNECMLKSIREEILQYAPVEGNFGGYGISVIQTKSRATYDMEAMKKDGINIDKYLKETKNTPSYMIKIDD